MVIDYSQLADDELIEEIRHPSIPVHGVTDCLRNIDAFIALQDAVQFSKDHIDILVVGPGLDGIKDIWIGGQVESMKWSYDYLLAVHAVMSKNPQAYYTVHIYDNNPLILEAVKRQLQVAIPSDIGSKIESDERIKNKYNARQFMKDVFPASERRRIEGSNQNFSLAGVSEQLRNNIITYQGEIDGASIPMADVIIALNVLEYGEDHKKAKGNLIDAVREGGYLLTNAGCFRGPSFFNNDYQYRQGELTEILSVQTKHPSIILYKPLAK